MNVSTCCRVAFTILVTAALGAAQSQRQPGFSHPLTVQRDRSERVGLPRSASAFPETLHVLAAMIAFQEDTDPRSSGTGSFETAPPAKPSVDPAPHDSAYVGQHLAFLENYYRKASRGKLIVKGDALGSVYRLPYQMQHYSPPRGSTNNLELGLLMRDAWHLVDSTTPGLPFVRYQAFVIVHAGAGRDIDLTSLFGFDPTPFDIPSIYLNEASLRKMFGDSYTGVPVAGGADTIRNSIIIPESESRDVPTSVGTARLQLGINGLLAASMGSHLGLPDLFDTKSGASGIGRFGLMDGQSIFSWSGLFPPEPSAWERTFLGWTTPIVLTGGDALYSLPAASIAGVEDSVYRVVISAREYFLVENRNRDANRDGSTVTLIRNGATLTRSWARDTVGFNAFDIDSLYGVVTDVDEFDWSLPGGVSSGTHEFFDGGILIWHIDEGVIDANYETDAVNADPGRRGVNLEEADGSQDIGQSYGLISPGSGSEEGTVLDFWYAGNRAPLRVRSNAFTSGSHPGSSSNDHADSHISISEFSSRAPRMTARIRVGDEQVSIIDGFPKATVLGFGGNSLTVAPYSGILPQAIIGATLDGGPAPSPNSGTPMPAALHAASRLYGWQTGGAPILPGGDFSGLLAKPDETFGLLSGKVAAGDLNGDGTIDITLAGTRLVRDPPAQESVYGWTLRDGNADHAIDTLFTGVLPNPITTSPVVSDSFLAFGTKRGLIYLLRHDGAVAESIRVSSSDTSDVVSLTLYENPGSFLAVTANGSVAVTGLSCPDNRSSLTAAETRMHASYALAARFSASSGKKIVLASRDGLVSIFGFCPYTGQEGLTVSTGAEILNAPAVADLDGDKSKDVIVFSGNRIFAINAIGSILDHFPVTAPTAKPILTSPIVADIDGDGSPDVVAVTQEGLVLAYDKSGRMLSGFPLLAGPNGGSTPVAFYLPDLCLSCAEIGLAVASDDGHVYGWKTGTLRTGVAAPPDQPWPQFLHDARNTGLSDTLLAAPPPASTFFPASRAYNWPNPVDRAHGYKTHIRYFLNSAASVHVRIIDLAGDQVTEFDAPGTGGLDNEVEWDVSAIQSGIYFAHIDAAGSGGSGSAVIKIAVIK